MPLALLVCLSHLCDLGSIEHQSIKMTKGSARNLFQMIALTRSRIALQDGGTSRSPTTCSPPPGAQSAEGIPEMLEIATEADPSAFYRAFVEWTGMAPVHYRRQWVGKYADSQRDQP